MNTRSWRQETFRSSGNRRLAITLFTLLAAGLLGWLLWLLLRPFWLPTTHLLFVSVDDGAPLSGTSLAYVEEDFVACQSLSPWLGRTSPARHRVQPGSTSWAPLFRSLSALPLDQQDVLLLYLRAAMVADGERVEILVPDKDSQEGSWLPLPELIDRVSQLPAATKFLILDTDSCNPLAAVAAAGNNNDSLEVLQRAVSSTEDAGLWVLMSHAAKERSYASPALRRTVFGHFATRGLAGAADLDRSSTIEAGELHRYIAVSVAHWVRTNGGGGVSQTPLLFRGDGSLASAAGATLLSRLDESTAEATGETAAVETYQYSGAASDLPGIHLKSSDQLFTESVTAAAPDGVLGQQMTSTAQAQRRRAPEEPSENPEDGGEENSDESVNSPASPGAIDVTDATESGIQQNNETSTAARPTPAVSQPVAELVGSAPIDAARRVSPASSLPLEQMRQLLSEAWRLRDALLAGYDVTGSPLQRSPHLRRRLELFLLSYEQRVRHNSQIGAADIADMQAQLDALRYLSGNKAAVQPPMTPLTRALTDFASQQHVYIKEPASFGWAELAARNGDASHTKLLQAAQQFDQLLARGNRDELHQWLAIYGEVGRQCEEYQLAKQWADVPQLDWSTVRFALKTRRAAEQVATIGTWAGLWLHPQMQVADRYRLAGERTLDDRVDADWQLLGQRHLRTAEKLYQKASQDAQLIFSAIDLQRTCLYEAPMYVRWYAASGLDTRGPEPTASTLERFLNELIALSRFLTAPDAELLEEVRTSRDSLAEFRAQLQNKFSDTVQLHRPPAQRGDTWRIARLLETALPNAVERARLLSGLPQLEAELVAAMTLPDPIDALLPSPAVTADQWEHSTNLLLLLRRLMSLTDVTSDAPPRRWNVLDQQLAELQTLVRQLPHAGDSPNLDHRILAAQDQCRAIIDRYFNTLAGRTLNLTRENRQLSSAELWGVRLRQLRQAALNLYLLDGRQVDSLKEANPVADVKRAELYSLIRWHRDRVWQAARGASDQQRKELANRAAAFRTSAEEIPQQPELPTVPVETIHLEGTSELSLTVDVQDEVDLILTGRGQLDRDVWLILRFDPDLLEVFSDSTANGYEMETIRQEFLRAGEQLGTESGSLILSAPAAPMLRRLNVEPSLRLGWGERQRIRLRVRRLQGTAFPARLLVEAISDDQHVRHDVLVRLPTPPGVNVLVEGIPNSWTPQEDGFALHPFPNRPTDFRLSLASTSGVNKKVSVTLLPSTQHGGLIPFNALNEEDADIILRHYAPGPALAMINDLELPASGAPIPLPFPPLVPPEEDESTEASEQDDAGGSAGPVVVRVNENFVSGNVVLPNQLLLAIQDQGSKLQVIQRLEILPQRPPRYARARVDYDSARQRIEATVGLIDDRVAGPDPVSVEAECVPPLLPGASSKLSGLIEPPAFSTTLFAEVPRGTGKVVRWRIHIDGYPRAFVYDIPCDRYVRDVPPLTDVAEVRIAELPGGTVYRTPVDTIPIVMEVDAPVGAFDTRRDLVQVGVDIDRDRELQGESSLRIYSDRAVKTKVSGYSPAGVISLIAEIGDFHLELPPPGVRSGRANVIARLLADPSSVWSEPVEITFDGSAPSIRDVQLLSPGFIVLESDFQVSAMTSDSGMSGVAQLEMALDVAKSGEFAGNTPVPADRMENGSWVATLTATGVKPGRHRVLLRATDEVGHQSEYRSLSIEVITPETVAALNAERTNRVTGIVRYGGQPVEGFEVNMTGGPDGPLGPVATDEAGRFVFEKVKLGSWVVSTEGVFRNKTRRAEQQVEVIALPARLPSLPLDVK